MTTARSLSYASRVSLLPRLSPLATRYASTMAAPVDPATLPTVAQTHGGGSGGLADRICIWKGDITKLKADMIVNAANKSLLGGGGVDGAIHRAAGKELVAECSTLGGADTGQTKVTKGYKLPATYVAHTVGPVYSQSRADQCAKQLASCYRTALEQCAEKGGGTIAFPSVSTDGYPIVDATKVALQTTRDFLDKNDSVKNVVYVVFQPRDEEVYNELVTDYFPVK